MKTYAAVIASLALVGASTVSVAETTTTTVVEHSETTQIHTASPLSVMNADDIEGKDVVDSTGRHLGDIDELVKDESNQLMVVIGLKGSAKEVVIPLDKLAMTSDSHTFSTTLTRDQLEALPDYDPGDMQSVKE